MGSVSKYLRQNVVGFAALFVALNAGAYAATVADSGAAGKTVFNSDLHTGSVDSRVIAQGGVTGPDIAASAVGPHKMKLDKLVKFLQTRVNGSCPAGQTVQGILADGSVLCATGNSGTITGVTTSGGLTGGGNSGDVALGVDPSVIQSRVTDTCSGNNAVQSIGENGGTGCASFLTGVTAGTGLLGGTISDSGTISVDPTAVQSRVSGACTGTEMLQSVAQNGTVGCQAIPEDGAAGTATLRSLGTGAAQAAAGDDPRLSDARTPTGAAGGELSGTYPNPSLDTGSVDTTNFAALPGARMFQTPTHPTAADPNVFDCQEVPAGGFPSLIFDGVENDNDVTFDNATDSLTVHTAGTYLVTAYAEWDANPTGSRALGFNASGTPGGNGFDTRLGTGDTDTQGQSAMQILHLDAGTTLTANVAQTITGGGLLPLQDLGAHCASLAVQWLAP